MNRPGVSVIAISLLFAAGAASADEAACADRHSPVKPQVDLAKVMRVESAAQQNGVQVYWINPPQVDAAKVQTSDRTYRFKSKRQRQG